MWVTMFEVEIKGIGWKGGPRTRLATNFSIISKISYALVVAYLKKFDLTLFPSNAKWT